MVEQTADNLISFLHNWGIGRPGKTAKWVKRRRDPMLSDFLHEYSELATRRVSLDTPTPTPTIIYPDSTTAPPLGQTTALALTTECIYFHDPLLRVSREWKGHEICGQPSTPELRDHLSHALSIILELLPLLEPGYVRLAADAGVAFEREFSPLLLPDHPKDPAGLGALAESIARLGLDAFPSHVRPCLQEHLVIEPGQWGGGSVRHNRPDVFALGFRDEPFAAFYYDPSAYSGFAPCLGSRPLPRIVPSTDDLRASLNRATYDFAFDRITALESDFYLARSAGARFSTDLTVSQALTLLALGLRPEPSDVTKVTLQLEIPFLSGITCQELANARRDEEAAAAFRAALETAAEEAIDEHGTVNQARLDELRLDMIDKPLREYKERVAAMRRTLRTGAFQTGIWTLAVVGGALLGGDVGPMTATMAGARTIHEAYGALAAAREEKIRLATLPGFFLWQSGLGRGK